MSLKPYTSKEEQTMNKVYTIFSELLKLCPRYHFDKACGAVSWRPIREDIYDVAAIYGNIVFADHAEG